MDLDLPRRGGKRPGAGRPRKKLNPDLAGPGVPHLRREDFAERFPVHVTLRLRRAVGVVSEWRLRTVVEGAFRDARERSGMRIIHYSIQSNHIHLVVEAEGAFALSRALQGLATRIARRLNARLRRRGSVFADRYHAHVLRSRRETAHAVRYVLRNSAHHQGPRPAHWEDPASSARYLRRAPGADAPVVAPRVWLLRIGWLQEPERFDLAPGRPARPREAGGPRPPARGQRWERG